MSWNDSAPPTTGRDGQQTRPPAFTVSGGFTWAMDGRLTSPPEEPLLALTLWQPWAWCIAHGTKRVENR